MTTTPEGLPAWSRTATAEDRGGHSDKRDYQNLGVINPRTDVSAAQFLRLCADSAAVARVAPFSVVTLTCNDSSPAAPTVHSVFQMDGVAPTGYAGDSPPSGFPTCTRVSNGKVQVVWPNNPADEFSVNQAFSVSHLHAKILEESSFATIAIVSVNAYTYTFEALDSGGSAISDAKMTIEVY